MILDVCCWLFEVVVILFAFCTNVYYRFLTMMTIKHQNAFYNITLNFTLLLLLCSFLDFVLIFCFILFVTIPNEVCGADLGKIRQVVFRSKLITRTFW